MNATSRETTTEIANDVYYPSRYPLWFLCTGQLVLFLTLFQLILIALYTAGNYRYFLDSNLFFLLNFATKIAAVNAILLAFYFVQIIVVSVMLLDVKTLFRLLRWLLFALATAITLLFSRLITYLGEGF